MLGVNLTALIVGFTCGVALFVRVGSWLRRRKRCGWSNVARVHEEGARAARCPNRAHEDERAAAREAGVLGHRVARLKGLKKYSRFADSNESPLRPNPKATNEDSEDGFLRGARQTVVLVAAAPDLNVGCVDDQVYAL